MSGMIGSDVEAVDALAAAMGQSAHQLDQIRSRVQTALRSVYWEGSDATGLRHEWDSRHSKVLAAAAQSLLDAQRRLTEQAQQQRDASAAEASGASVLLGPAVPASTGQSPWALVVPYVGLSISIGQLADLLGSASTELGDLSPLFSGTGWVARLGNAGPGIALSVAEIAYNWNQHGLYDSRTEGAILLGVLGGTFGIVSGPAGLAFGVSELAASYVAESTGLSDWLADQSLSQSLRGQTPIVDDPAASYYRDASPSEIVGQASRLEAARAQITAVNECWQKPWLSTWAGMEEAWHGLTPW